MMGIRWQIKSITQTYLVVFITWPKKDVYGNQSEKFF
jgi:hypothetical protein